MVIVVRRTRCNIEDAMKIKHCILPSPISHVLFNPENYGVSLQSSQSQTKTAQSIMIQPKIRKNHKILPTRSPHLEILLLPLKPPHPLPLPLPLPRRRLTSIHPRINNSIQFLIPQLHSPHRRTQPSMTVLRSGSSSSLCLSNNGFASLTETIPRSGR